MPNVLADRHHAGLFHSLQLMARRFGWTLSTPIGREWWDEGYWQFGRSSYGDDRLARQYLGAPREPDGEFPDWPIDFVTLDEARAMPWDYVIATVPDNEHGFHRFAQETGAQFVEQVGNTGQWVDWRLNPLVLSSSEMPMVGPGVVYHQEMDPIAFRTPSPPQSDGGLVRSFVNCMPDMGRQYEGGPAINWKMLKEAQSLGVEIVVYGIDGPAGIVKPFSRLVQLMGRSHWGWHDKAQGDGFGHVIHSWAAVGRPLVGHASHYRGKLAEHFWQDGLTCIDLDRHSVVEAVEIIRTISPAEHEAMCRAIRAEFDTIDYDAEADRIADLLGVAVAA